MKRIVFKKNKKVLNFQCQMFKNKKMLVSSNRNFIKSLIKLVKNLKKILSKN